MPEEMREKQKQKALKQAVKLLVMNGIIQTEDVSFPESQIA
jgi:hypothetical protein